MATASGNADRAAVDAVWMAQSSSAVIVWEVLEREGIDGRTAHVLFQPSRDCFAVTRTVLLPLCSVKPLFPWMAATETFSPSDHWGPDGGAAYVVRQDSDKAGYCGFDSKDGVAITQCCSQMLLSLRPVVSVDSGISRVQAKVCRNCVRYSLAPGVSVLW